MVEVLTAGNIDYSIWSKERIEIDTSIDCDMTPEEMFNYWEIDDTQPEKAIKHIEKIEKKKISELPSLILE